VIDRKTHAEIVEAQAVHRWEAQQESDEYAPVRKVLQHQLDAALAELERRHAVLLHFLEWSEKPRRSVKVRGIKGTTPTYRIYDEIQRVPQ
jgi:hypothetical protein